MGRTRADALLGLKLNAPCSDALEGLVRALDESSRLASVRVPAPSRERHGASLAGPAP